MLFWVAVSHFDVHREDSTKPMTSMCEQQYLEGQY